MIRFGAISNSISGTADQVLKVNAAGTNFELSSISLSGVSSIGNLDSQTKDSKGAQIVGTVLNLQTASGVTYPGLISTGSQIIGGTKTFTSDIYGNLVGDVTGNAGTVTAGVYTSTNQTINGIKTFSSTIVGSINGNAGTVTNGVYTSGDQNVGGVKTFTSDIKINANIGYNTGTTFYAADSNSYSLSLYGGGASSTSGGSIILYGVTNAAPGRVLIRAGTTAGDIIFQTSGNTAASIDTNRDWNFAGNNLFSIGSVGVPTSYVTYGHFTNLKVTNAISGSITGNAATSDSSDKVYVTATSANYGMYLGLISGSTGSRAVYVDGGAAYNPSTNIATLNINGNAGTVTNGVYTTGDQSIAGNKTFSNEVRTTSNNSFRMVAGNYGSFWRNDGSNLFLMSTASADQYGSWNSYRPITYTFSNGSLSLTSAQTLLLTAQNQYNIKFETGGTGYWEIWGLNTGSSELLHTGSAAELGTYDNYSLSFFINNGAAWTINTAGDLCTAAGDSISGSTGLNLSCGTGYVRFEPGNGANQGIAVGPAGNMTPWSNNSQAVGTSSYKFANMYATTFHGALTPFTGLHTYAFDTVDIPEMGDAVRLVNKKMRKCTTARDKTCIGLYTGQMYSPGNEDDRASSIIQDSFLEEYQYDENNNPQLGYIAACGDSRTPSLSGAKVCNEGGNIEDGDLLCTASSAGYLMKQEDDIIRAYTVAQCRQTVIFDENGRASGIYVYFVK
jgi:hypothetical protein